jgi:hypothetical protein
LDGVTYRPIAGAAPIAPLLLATRRADTSAVLRRFIALVRSTG